MQNRLIHQMCARYFLGLVIVALLLFLPAGSVRYWNAWLFMGVLFIPILIAGLLLLKASPELLAKRLNTREQETEQKQVIVLSALMFAGGFAVAALDFRYQWSTLPGWAVITAAIAFLAAYGLFAVVMRENAYLSRTVEVQENQQVIDTGLYGIVRHPMYSATVILFLSAPLILGSLYAFAVFLICPLLLIKRIKNEEIVLEAGLAGYKEYTRKVKYRLIPFIW